MIAIAILAFLVIMTGAIVAVFVGLPAMPTELVSVVDWLVVFLRGGYQLMNVFCYPAVVIPCLAFRLALEAVYKGYKLVMWAAKKVPMWGVD